MTWPKVQVFTEFELFVPKIYRYIPESKSLELMEGMNATMRFNGAQNRNLIIVGSPYPMQMSTYVYRYNDYKNKILYERVSLYGVYCNKFPIRYDLDIQTLFSSEIYN